MNAASQRKISKILILSGPLGHGHKQTAKSIAEVSKLTRDDVEVEVVDYMELTSPHLYQVGTFCYSTWVRTFPGMYGFLYNKTRKENLMIKVVKKVRGSRLRALENFIAEMNPSIIVSTFPPAAAAVSQLKARGGISCPTVTIITDHTDHSYWLNTYTDQYLVGSQRVARALTAHGIPQSRIEVTGIPVRPAFYKPYNKERLREKYNMHPTKTTVLVMGGGWGIIPSSFLRFVQQDQWKDSVQLIVICGQNEKLREKLQRIARSTQVDMKILGYVEQIQEYMALSDLMITKPGGISTSEALTQQLPMLLYKALPGQEEDNVQYLLDSGLAEYAPTEEMLQQKFMELIQHPERLRSIRHRAQTEKRHSPYNAFSAIMKLENAAPMAVYGGETVRLKARPMY